MKSKKDINIWDPNEIVYKAGDKSVSAYLVLDGSAEIISADGVKLNSFGPNELFGEASLVLKSDRTVSVVAGPSGLSAKVISSANLRKRLKKALKAKIVRGFLIDNKEFDFLRKLKKKDFSTIKTQDLNNISIFDESIFNKE